MYRKTMRKKSFEYFDELWDLGRRRFDDLWEDEACILAKYIIEESSEYLDFDLDKKYFDVPISIQNIINELFDLAHMDKDYNGDVEHERRIQKLEDELNARI